MELQRKRARSIAGDPSGGAKRKQKLLLSSSSPPPPPAAAAAAAAPRRISGPPPLKFMFFDKGAWSEFPGDSSGALREAFAAGRDVVRLILSSCVYFVSFVHMLQVQAETGYARSIAWLDDRGELCSPANPFEGSAPAAWSARKESPSPRRSPSPSSSSESSGEVVDELAKLTAGLTKLGDSEPGRWEVERLFLEGLGIFSSGAEVTGVYGVSFGPGSSGAARREAFESRSELTGRVRGHANVQYAWYGCSKEELAMIIQHGFGRPTRDSSYGVGVYLTPERLSRLGCVGADVDENGEQRLLLCRVIVGNSELVQPGSIQFHPSSEEFDTGVDSLAEPKKLIVWSTHMNTHILPVYVASFKLPKEWHELMQASSGGNRGIKSTLVHCKPKGVSPGASSGSEKTSSIPKLLTVLKPELSGTEMSLLEAHYIEHKNGKISREEFLKRVRALAGDEKLRKLVQRFTANTKGSDLSGKRSTIAFG